MHLTSSDVLSGLPAEWQAKMAENELIPVTSGMSGAYVFRIPDRQAGDQYLKVGIGTNADQLRREGARTKWLASVGLRVPEVIMQFDGTNLFAMTMAALDGQSAVFTSPDNWRPVVNAIAHAFATMHSLPTNSCPFDETLHVRLARARELIRRGEIDAAQFNARNAGITPAELYRRLEAGIPAQEDCVVTHGDATLSNLIFGNDGKIGFVDAAIAATPTATSILLCYLQSSQIGSDRKRATFFWRRMAGFIGICRRLNFIATSTNYFDVHSALGASGC